MKDCGHRNVGLAADAEASLAALTKLVPMSQLLFGTDFPFVRIPITVDGFREFKFSPDDVQAINGGNALRLFPRLKK
jgi:predicted TIM-barrel fold metal-dependent hydrolase